jgi:hypothetical protein
VATQPGPANAPSSTSNLKNYVETTMDIDVKRIQDIPDFKKLLELGEDDEGGSFKCKVLRKKIIGTDKEGVKYVYVSDPRQVKSFQKRKNKSEKKKNCLKKTTLKEKMSMKEGSIIEGRSVDRSRRSNETGKERIV